VLIHSRLEEDAAMCDHPVAVRREAAEPAVPTRRRLLGWSAAIAAALGLGAYRDQDAGAKRKKKHKKHKKPPAPPYASCEDRCHPSCTRCFLRPEGTPLYASQGSSHCAYNCTSDSNCVGTGYPYCTTGSYHFASGTLNTHDDCLNGNTMICSDVEPCG
jgi:hypothetical protein